MSGDPATAAFERLGAELTLLRHAVEGFVSQHTEAPVDYAPTLAKLTKSLAELDAKVDGLQQHPFLKVTPDGAGEYLRRAVAGAIAEPKQVLSDAVNRLGHSTAGIDKSLELVRWRENYLRNLVYAAGAGAVVSLLAWSALFGPLLRALPASWQAPERMAAAILGENRWTGGGRMMKNANPEAWRRIQLVLAPRDLANEVGEHGRRRRLR